MSNRALLPFSKMTGLLSTVSSKLESAIVKEHHRASLCCIIVLSKHMIRYWFFCKRMPTGQNSVQPTTQAAKYYKSLSLSLLLPFFPRESLLASPQCWWIEENTLVKSSITLTSASNIAIGRRGALNSKSPPKAECLMSFVRDCCFQVAFIENILDR